MYRALVCDLSRPGDDPKIVKSSELWRIKEGNECVAFKPTSLKFNRHEEFGLVVKKNGEKTMVKHSILALSENVEELSKLKTEKRLKPPLRLSITPVEAPFDEYTFPQLDLANKRLEREDKVSKTNAIKLANSQHGKSILHKFENITLRKSYKQDVSDDASVKDNEVNIQDCTDTHLEENENGIGKKHKGPDIKEESSGRGKKTKGHRSKEKSLEEKQVGKVKGHVERRKGKDREKVSGSANLKHEERETEQKCKQEDSKAEEKERGAEQRCVQEEIDAEKKRFQEEKDAETKRIQEEKDAETKRIQEEKDAEKKRIQEEKVAEQKRIQEELDAEKKRVQEEIDAEKKRIQEELDAKQKRIQEELDAKQKRIQEELDAKQKRNQEELDAEKKRIQEELDAKQKSNQEVKVRDKMNSSDSSECEDSGKETDEDVDMNLSGAGNGQFTQDMNSDKKKKKYKKQKKKTKKATKSKKRKKEKLSEESCNKQSHLQMELELKSCQEKLKEQEKTINDLKQKCDQSDLVSQLRSMLSSEEKTSVLKKSKISKLATLPSNLVDEEAVEEGKVKVGHKRYVSRKMIEEVETNVRYLTARIEALVDVFYGGKVHKYSVKQCSKHVIEDAELSSIEKILLSMKWHYNCAVDAKKVRARVIKYASECRVAKNSQQKKSKKDSKNSKKKKGDEDSSSEEEEQNSKRKRKDGDSSSDEDSKRKKEEDDDSSSSKENGHNAKRKRRDSDSSSSDDSSDSDSDSDSSSSN